MAPIWLMAWLVTGHTHNPFSFSYLVFRISKSLSLTIRFLPRWAGDTTSSAHSALNDVDQGLLNRQFQM